MIYSITEVQSCETIFFCDKKVLSDNKQNIDFLYKTTFIQNCFNYFNYINIISKVLQAEFLTLHSKGMGHCKAL